MQVWREAEGLFVHSEPAIPGYLMRIVRKIAKAFIFCVIFDKQ